MKSSFFLALLSLAALLQPFEVEALSRLSQRIANKLKSHNFSKPQRRQEPLLSSSIYQNEGEVMDEQNDDTQGLVSPAFLRASSNSDLHRLRETKFAYGRTITDMQPQSELEFLEYCRTR